MNNEDQRFNTGINAVISGPVNGQVAIGHGITQTQTIGVARPEVTQAELAALQQMLADLKVLIETEAPAEKKEAALERAAELEDAITAEKPDLTTMDYVKRWFARYLPGLAAAVTGIVVHPIVGKLVEAAGDTLAAGVRRRLEGT